MPLKKIDPEQQCNRFKYLSSQPVGDNFNHFETKNIQTTAVTRLIKRLRTASTAVWLDFYVL